MKETVKNINSNLVWKEIEKCESNSGFILKKDLLNNKISMKWLEFFVDKNTLMKVDAQRYLIPWKQHDYQAYIQSQIPTAIFCLETALIYHNLSDRFFDWHFIAVKKGIDTKKYKKQFKNIWMFIEYDNDKEYQLGIIKVKTENNKYVYVYDLERTICDIIKYRDKINTEVFRNAIHDYFDSCDVNSKAKLIKYAKVLGIEDKVRLCMEIL